MKGGVFIVKEMVHVPMCFDCGVVPLFVPFFGVKFEGGLKIQEFD